MKLCFTHTSLAARDFSGDPGSEGLKKCHKSLSIPGHQIDRAETWFQTLFQKLPWISVHFSSDCQWWLTMESNLTKTTEVFSAGFLCKFKKIKLKKKKCEFFWFFSHCQKMRMWEHEDATLLLSFPHHAGKEHSKQMYWCPSQADQAKFADLFTWWV